MSFIKKLYYLGLHKGLSFKESKQVVLSNQLILTLILVTTPYSSIFFLLGLKFLGIMVIPIQLMYSLCLFFNYKRRYFLAKIIFFMSVGLPLYIYAAAIGKNAGIQFGFFFLFIITFVLMQNTTHLIRILCQVFPITMYLILEISSYQFFIQYKLKAPYLAIIFYSIVLTTFITIYLIINFYASLSSHLEKIIKTTLKLQNITQREAEVVTEIRLGKTNKEISQTLYIEESTVKIHVKNIFKKLNVKNRLALMAKLSDNSQ